VPKEIQEVSQFITGTMTTPSERDIPPDAASFSLNIEPASEDGILQGVPEDSNLQYDDGSASDITVNVAKMATINNDGQRDLVAFDGSANLFKQVPNLHSATANASNISATTQVHEGTPCMAVNNKEVHVGMGSSSTSVPKWVGYIPHGQFGGSAPSGLQLENAKLQKPASWTDMHKVVSDSSGAYIYGIEYGGQTIYKFKVSDGTLENASKPILKQETELTALTISSDGNLWILDSSTYNRSTGIIGTMYKVNSGTLKTTIENQLKVYSSGDTSYNKYSDMIEIGSLVWLSSFDNSSSSSSNNVKDSKAWLVSLTKPTESGNQTVSFRAPTLIQNTSNQSAHIGKFHTSANDDATLYARIPPVNLIKFYGNTDYCGVAIHLQSTDTSAGPDSYVNVVTSANTDSGNIKSAILSIHTGSTSASKIDGSNNKIHGIELSDGTEQVLFWDHNGAHNYMGNITAASESHIAISIKDTDAADCKLYHMAMYNPASVNNGDPIVVTPSAVTNITTPTMAIAPDSSNFDLHCFASGNSTGRWLKVDSWSNTSVGSVPSSATSVVSQADLNMSLSLKTGTVSSSVWPNDSEIFYKASYTYDGYQESPLSPDFKISQSGASKEVQVVLNIYNTSSLSKRVSHVNLYCAIGSDGASEPTGFYRLVESVSINNSWVDTADDTTAPDWGVSKSFSFLHSGTVGASYEARTGVSEIIDDTILNYGLSTQLNNQLFVADCYHPQLTGPSDDIKNYIFKSRPYNYDQFNYVQDFLALPTTPTAIIGFRGRIYVFDENNMYKIEPNNFYIEDTIEGIGCLSADAVYANDYGMCIADNNNIYLYDGSRPIPIGESILKGSDVSWENRDTSFNSKVTFDSSRKCFVVFFKTTETVASSISHTGTALSSGYFAWAYNLQRKRWDCWYITGNSTKKPKSILLGKNGEIIYAGGTSGERLVHFLGHASDKKKFSWISKKMHMGQNTGDKSFKNLKIIGSPAGTIGDDVYVKIDDSDITETSITGLTDIDLGNSRGKQIQIFVKEQTSSIDAFGVIFRRYIKLSKQN